MVLDSDDSEYVSYFYASVTMPPVEDLIPISTTKPQGITCFLSEESMSEPRIWFIMNGLWPIRGITYGAFLMGFGLTFESMNPILQMPLMNSLKSIVGLNPM